MPSKRQPPTSLTVRLRWRCYFWVEFSILSTFQSHHPTTSTWPYMLPPRTQTHHSFKFHFYPFPAQPLHRLIERPFLRLSKQHCHGDLLVKKGAIKTHNHFAQKERKLSDAGPESVGTIYGIKSEMNPRQQQQQQQTAHKPWNVWNLCTKNTTHTLLWSVAPVECREEFATSTTTSLSLVMHTWSCYRPRSCAVCQIVKILDRRSATIS